MKLFMDNDFLLNTQTAKELYHKTAAKMPIIDYHCHIEAKEIAEDRKFDNIAQVWLNGDHYKWRAMRICGTPERSIIGDLVENGEYPADMPRLKQTVADICCNNAKVYFGWDKQ